MISKAGVAESKKSIDINKIIQVRSAINSELQFPLYENFSQF